MTSAFFFCSKANFLKQNNACMHLLINIIIFFFFFVVSAVKQEAADNPSNLQVQCYLSDEFARGSKLTVAFESTTACSVVPESFKDLFGKIRYDPSFSMSLVRNEKKVESMFEVNQQDASLITKQKIDREDLCTRVSVCCSKQKVCTFPLVVMMRHLLDNVEVFKFLQVEVQLLDLNDHQPEFSQQTKELEIMENAAIGTRFLLPSASDPDSIDYSINSYQLEPSDGPFTLKIVDNADGQQNVFLNVSSGLDRERKEKYIYRLIASDRGDPPKTGVLTLLIHIKDSNDNYPQFTQREYNVSVSEMVTLGTKLVQLRATDHDQGANAEIIYLFGQSTSQEVYNDFRLDAETGWLVVNKRLDFETRRRYVIPVIARDRPGHPNQGEANINIEVLDSNDNAPHISLQYFLPKDAFPVIHESVKPVLDHTVGFVTVSDPDTGSAGQVDCYVKDNQKLYLRPAFDNANMVIKKKDIEYQLKLNGTLDREINATESFKICCKDRGEPPQNACLVQKITVQDVNDNRPIFQQVNYTAELQENNPIGKSVLRVHAVDIDAKPNNQVTYTLLDDTGNNFEINGQTGWILAKQVFDREVSSRYDFRVQASDAGGLSSTALVTVLITDQNDEVPRFLNFNSYEQDHYLFQVGENLPPDTEVGVVVVEDGDLGDNARLVYTLSGQANSNEFVPEFRIDSTLGKIFTRKKLDREYRASYNLFVTVSDSPRHAGVNINSAQTRVHIEVLDENDEEPKIQFPTQHNNSFWISYQEMMGHVILTVRARDRDAEKNNQLQYEIVAGDHKGLFGIDPHSGEVSVSRDMRESDQRTYHLKVRVRDSGENPRESQVSLQIIVDGSRPIMPLNKTQWPTSTRIGSSVILVIIVALICAIILVMLGMTLYIFNRRGIFVLQWCDCVTASQRQHQWKSTAVNGAGGIMLTNNGPSGDNGSARNVGSNMKRSIEETECAVAFLPGSSIDAKTKTFSSYPRVDDVSADGQAYYTDDGYKILDIRMMGGETQMTEKKGFNTLKSAYIMSSAKEDLPTYYEMDDGHTYTVEQPPFASRRSAQSHAKLHALSNSEGFLDAVMAENATENKQTLQKLRVDNAPSLGGLLHTIGKRLDTSVIYDELRCNVPGINNQHQSKVFSVPKGSFV